MNRRVFASKGLKLDKRRDCDYTDWKAVGRPVRNSVCCESERKGRVDDRPVSHPGTDFLFFTLDRTGTSRR